MTTATAPGFAIKAGEFIDHRFRAMGCDVRIFAAPRAGESAEALVGHVARAQGLVHACAARLTRFEAGSELRHLDADPRSVVPVSPLLARAIQTAVLAAEASGGLVDPTLADAVEGAGYRGTWDPARRLPLADLLAAAPRRAAAQPAEGAVWRQVRVDRVAGTVTRPPGLRLDLGGTAKGLIADLALRCLTGAAIAFVDAGGDLAIDAPHLVVTAHDPFGGSAQAIDARGRCGIATSTIALRSWTTPSGPAHHLLNPSTGCPAFTGVVQASACAPSAAAAERIAGQAVLGGPAGARAALSAHGGLYITDDGTTHHIQPEAPQ